jgi:hypothetical protein
VSVSALAIWRQLSFAKWANFRLADNPGITHHKRIFVTVSISR